METLKYTGYAVAGFSLLPFILPELGFGGRASEVASEICSTAAISDQTGWAGTVAGALSHLPLIGSSLATAGIPAVAIAATVGIGGMLLARHLEKKGTEIYGFPAGKIVRWLALGTSVLFALPSILSGITMALHFLAIMFDRPGYLTASFSMPDGSWQMRLADSIFYQDGANAGIAAGLRSAADTVGTVAAGSITGGVLGSIVTALICCVPAGMVAWMAGEGKGQSKSDIAVARPGNTVYGPIRELLKAPSQTSKALEPTAAHSVSAVKQTHQARVTSTLPLASPAL
jgi:hypothetical protein